MFDGRLFAGKLFAGRLFQHRKRGAVSDVFDAPYQAYVKQITAERAGQVLPSKNDVAIQEARDYDSRVGRGAPRIGAIQALPDVAPILNDDVQTIRIQAAESGRHPSKAISSKRIAVDDEAAIMAFFMLMADDD